MNYITGALNGLGHRINTVSTYTGSLVDTAIEGRYGIGAIQEKILSFGKALGEATYNSHLRLTYLGKQSLTMAVATYTGAEGRRYYKACYLDSKNSTKENDDSSTLKKKILPMLSFEGGALLGAGLIYFAANTNFGFSNITMASTREIIAKTAVSMGDATAMAAILHYSQDKILHCLLDKTDNPPILPALLVATFLTGRLYDTVIQYGVMSHSFVTGNIQTPIQSVNAAIGRIQTFASQIGETVIDGKYGLGALHGNLLDLGRRAGNIHIRFAHLATHAALLIGAEILLELGLFVESDLEVESGLEFDSSLEEGWIRTVLVVGLLQIAGLTNFGLKCITGEIAKKVMTQTALATGDVYAFFICEEESTTTICEEESTMKERLAVGYLAVRFADLFINYGAVMNGLLRCDLRPIAQNANWLMSWVR